MFSRTVNVLITNLVDVSDDSDTEMPDAWRDKQSTARKPESHKNFGNKRGKQKSQQKIDNNHYLYSSEERMEGGSHAK